MSQNLKKFFLIFGLLLIAATAGSVYWQLSPGKFIIHGGRLLVARVLGTVYLSDNADARRIRVNYYHGGARTQDYVAPGNSWKKLDQAIPGFTFLDDLSRNYSLPSEVPFIYEDLKAPYLVLLRTKYGLDAITADSPDEFSSMLQLGKWVGSLWDHGVDPLPEEGKYDPLAILSKSEQGSSYWCEIAAIVMVQAATSMGWPSRLVTASRDGYRWEHAVAELWSNQFEKWFVIDADYNIFYMADGKPLSAYELCRFGPTLQQKGKLQVKKIAPMKPSLKLQDLLPYYRYVHIDLRNDWYSRKLRRGSPAGGDLATWWTARPGLEHLLTAKKRVDDQSVFDWPVNIVSIIPEKLSYKKNSDNPELYLSLSGYSPYFERFQISLDTAEFKNLQGSIFRIDLQSGRHCLRARMITSAGSAGPVSSVCFEYQ
ncbi:hypothetical protein GF1_00560 [Desulfolithobacter dissulfuricans]|uniref:Transglutaminase-like domain-containing protein n=1 Tax=Desulfolithobacter dissulfuricans TaxID=2795293 RepID=A0A915TYR5_9BACT|nr:hypothetical protein [Desulfolithobacter dissulfuricans]BCO07680.1 hypothetical protein GF1_00560 [Desulfolithobacter dissulfuricans]